MRERAGILTLRSAHGSFGDLADRASLISRQRVRRPRAPRRPPRAGVPRGSLCLAALAAALVLAHWLFTSPRFAVAVVEVRGASRLAAPDLLAAAGIAPGENLFRIDPEAVTGRLEAVAGVRRARVVREFPNRVALVVEEREPFTLVQAGRLHWLDEEGVLLWGEPRAVTPPLPLLSGLGAEELGSGRARASDRALVALGVLRTLLRSGSPLLARLSEVDASRPDGPVLYTVDGTEIRLGSGEWEGQMARLEGLLDQISPERQPVEYVDLRFKDQVVFKPKTL